MESTIKNMELIESNVLKSRALSFEENGLLQEIKTFLKEEHNKEFSVFDHQGFRFDSNLQTKDQIEIHVLDDPNSLISLHYGVIYRPNGNKFESVRMIVIDNVNDLTVAKIIDYDYEIKDFVIAGNKNFEGTNKAAWETVKRNTRSGIFEELEKNPIVTFSFGDFCLPGGYQYCGKNCGKDLKYGGGSIKNKVDGCCYVHDECYNKYKTNRCANCDNALLRCVNNPVNYWEGPAAADAISLYFNSKCFFS